MWYPNAVRVLYVRTYINQALCDAPTLYVSLSSFIFTQDCRSGFIYGGVQNVPQDISCPNCKERMCLMCKKVVSVVNAFGVSESEPCTWTQGSFFVSIHSPPTL